MRNFLLISILAFNLGCHFEESSDDYVVTEFGAIGDGTTNNTEALQKAIDAASHAGGGVVYFPEGTYISGTIYLKDNVTIHVSKDAELKGSPRLADYPDNELETYRSYTERYSKKAFIYAEGVRNVTLEGLGVINGNSYAPEFEEAEHGRYKPLGIRLISCQNVTVRNLTIHSAGLWLQHYLNCENLLIKGITAINHGHFTNDGLNIDGSRQVRIEDVHIDSHDDALVFKSTGPAKCENVVVRNCVLKSHCHSLKFGTETTGGFKNIDISNISISASDSVHYKTNTYWKVITGVALEMVDGGQMENVHIRNLSADSVYAPIFVKLGNRQRKHREDAPDPGPGEINGLILENFKITNAGPFSSSITGFPGHKVKNVLLRNIRISYNEAPDADQIFTQVPENEERYPEITMFTKGMDQRFHLPSYGLFVRHVDGLTVDHFQVEPLDSDPRTKFVTIETERYRMNE